MKMGGGGGAEGDRRSSAAVTVLCQNSFARELKFRVVGFVLKRLFTHFEMLIVSYAVQSVDGFCPILPLLTLWHTVLV